MMTTISKGKDEDLMMLRNLTSRGWLLVLLRVVHACTLTISPRPICGHDGLSL